MRAGGTRQASDGALVSEAPPFDSALQPWLRPLTLVAWLLTLVGRNRALIRALVVRDLKSRYLGSMGGLAWSVAHPLLLLGIYAYVFSHVFRSAGNANVPFVVWLFCGLVPWLAFAEMLQRGCTAVLEHAQLVTKTVFPTQILVMIVVFAALANHLLALPVVALAVVVTTGHLPSTIALLPVYMLAMGLFALGVGWLTSALQVYVVRGYRIAFLGGPLPNALELAGLFGAALGSLIVGGLFFRRVKGAFADVL
jgi:ABC-type polysaccharide/polyol phosphate export permease